MGNGSWVFQPIYSGTYGKYIQKDYTKLPFQVYNKFDSCWSHSPCWVKDKKDKTEEKKMGRINPNEMDNYSSQTQSEWLKLQDDGDVWER